MNDVLYQRVHDFNGAKMSKLIDKVIQLKDDIKARTEDSCTCGDAEDANMMAGKHLCRSCELGAQISLDLTELIQNLSDIEEDQWQVRADMEYERLRRLES